MERASQHGFTEALRFAMKFIAFRIDYAWTAVLNTSSNLSTRSPYAISGPEYAFFLETCHQAPPIVEQINVLSASHPSPLSCEHLY